MWVFEDGSIESNCAVGGTNEYEEAVYWLRCRDAPESTLLVLKIVDIGPDNTTVLCEVIDEEA